MTGSQLRDALHSDRRVYGTLLVSDSPFWPTVVGIIPGLDFVFIDTEHIAQDNVRLSWMCRTYHAMGLPPIVRIPSPNPYRACQVLDGGARGVVAPYVETVDEVKQLVGAVKQRPLKGAKLDAILDAGAIADPKLSSYVEKRNLKSTLVVNIESVAAMEALDEIVAVPGVDGVLIGPHDLSCSLEVPEQYDHPKFRAAVEEIITKARRAGIGAGIHLIYANDAGIDHEIELARLGANLIIHSADAIAFRLTMGEQISRLRSELGDSVDANAGTVTI